MITLNDVPYVPEIGRNLLSVERIDDTGHYVTFDGGEVIIKSKRDNRIKARSTKVGRTYVIRDLGAEGRTPSAYLSTKTDLKLWHIRLAHLNFRDVQDITGITGSEDSICETCAKCKITAKPFPKYGATRAIKTLELVHSDVMDVRTTEAGDQERYVITFIDDYSWFRMTSFAKSKSEAMEKFVEFATLVENQQSATIKTLRTDRGGEYLLDNMKNYLQAKGIIHQLTVAYTPQQNGVAERRNRTLIEATRCLLEQSKLCAVWWTDAMRYATYIRNRVPSKATKGTTPYFLWNNREPTYNHLRAFGCRCWYKSKERTSKLEPKGKPGIMLGYAPTSKAYIVWDEEKQSRITARDIIFDDDVFPGLGEDITQHANQQLICADMNSFESEDEDEEQSTEDEVSFFGSAESEDSDDETTIELDPRPPSPQIKVPTDTTTRAGRQTRRPTWSKDYDMSAQTVTLNEEKDPRTVSEALRAPSKTECRKSIQEEYNNLERNKVWTIEKRQPGMRTRKSKWAFKIKRDSNGKIVRYRARLVALGNLQRPGIDYMETYSPVVRMRTTCTLMALAVENDWEIEHDDVQAAYLAGTLDETTYMELPEGYFEFGKILATPDQHLQLTETGTKSKWVCKVNQALYGLHQSWLIWYRKLRKTLLELGLQQSKADPCVFFDPTGDVIITVYVDDLIYYGTRRKIDAIKRKLARIFDLRHLGPAQLVQSIRIQRNKKGTIKIDQEAYTRELLKEFKMQDCKALKTPGVPEERYTRSNPDEELNPERAHIFRQLIGSLLYHASCTRPDINYSVISLSQFARNPAERHWKAANHILRYLKGTLTKGLMYRKTGKKPPLMYSDADWGADLNDRRSFSGYTTILAGAATSWSTRKQTNVALSTMEAKLVALAEAVQEELWTQSLLREIGQAKWCVDPLEIKVDNQSAIRFAESQASSERTKHIDLRKLFIQEEIENK